MANATVSISGNKCTITIAANPVNLILLPGTSGNADYTNYCNWSVGTGSSLVELGKWSAHRKDLTILENPKNLIDTTTKHGTITKSTSPAIVAGTMTLAFTHKVNANSPIEDDALKISADFKPNDKVTYITLLAEDGADTNFLDFQMTLIAHNT